MEEMKRFHITYAMNLTVNHAINHHYFSFRCLPKEGGRQHVDYARVRLNADYYAYSTDCFDNRFLYGYTEAPATSLSVFMEAEVAVDQAIYDRNSRLTSVLKLPTPQTQPEGALGEFVATCRAACAMMDDDMAKLKYIMTAVFAYMTYEKGSTDIKTKAVDAFTNGRGVCQDYAQIMLAIVRSMGYAARYVAGLMVNESLSHAWVGVFVDGKWQGFDPTNNRLVDDDYVILSTGRDYQDCLVNKGIFYCAEPVTQRSDIVVSMKEI